MAKYAVVKTGGKQYLVTENDQITVDSLEGEKGSDISLDVLATFDSEGSAVKLGDPQLKEKIVAKIVEHGKGEKLRVAKFKAKVRYRKVTGFRPTLTTLQITKI